MNKIASAEANQVTRTTDKMDGKTLWILIGVALGIFMGALESTIVGTAMPTVIATLGGIEIYSWVAVAYMLTSTIMTPIWGKMADLIGRRPAMFGGLALFLLGSALSGAAHSMTQLIIFRALQGLGAGALFPVGMTIIADTLSLERRTKVIGLFSGMWGVASLFGPLVGGFLTEHWSWRWVFYINLPFGLLAGVIIALAYHESKATRKNIHLDYLGTITLSLAMMVLLLVVERGDSMNVLPLITGVLGLFALIILFVVIERRSPEPLIPLQIFHTRMVTVTTLHGLFAGMLLFGAMVYLPLFVQAVMGRSPTVAGQILTPYILAWVLSSIIGSRMILRFGYRGVSIAGMILMVGGALMLAFVSATTTMTQIAVAVIFIGLGGGLTMATLMIGAQHAVPRTQLGVVTATVQFARSIGAAIGIGTMGAVLAWSLRRALQNVGGELAALASTVDVAALIRQNTRSSLAPQAAQFLQGALAGALQKAFMFGLIAVIVATVLSLLLPGGNAHDLVHEEPTATDDADDAVISEIGATH